MAGRKGVEFVEVTRYYPIRLVGISIVPRGGPGLLDC
jgi:hypothetical protein